MSIYVKKDDKGESAIAKDGKKFIDVIFNDNEEDDVVFYKPEKELEYIPNCDDEQRMALYISGSSGSGKSTFCAQTIKKLQEKKRFKKMPVLFFSAKNIDYGIDKAFNGIKNFIAIDIYDNTFLELDPMDVKDSICIFDDYDQVKDKEIYEQLVFVIKQLLELGRKNNTHIMIIRHQTMDYAKSRDIIFECDTYVLFPRVNMNTAVKFTKSYFSDNKDDLALIKKIKGKSFTPLILHKTVPQFMMCPKWIKLL